jgi:hypothetical protein
VLAHARFQALDAALQRCARGGTHAALDYTGIGNAGIVHTMALSDLQLSGPTAVSDAATTALIEALAAGRGPAALAVGERFAALDAALAERYVPCATLPAPTPPTGYVPADRRAREPRQIVYARAER